MPEDSTDKRIAALKQELLSLQRRKLTELQSSISQLESDIGSGSVAWAGAKRGRKTGRPPGRPPGKPGRKSGRRGPRGGRRLKDDEVAARLTEQVKRAGSAGTSARAAADGAGVFYLRAIKAMNKLFKKTGKGKWTRYTVK